VTTDQRSSLLIVKNTPDAAPGLVQPPCTGDDPEGAEDSKDETGDGDEFARATSALVGVDTKEGPGDGDGTSEITLGRGECVCGSGSFEDEESKEDEDLGPDTCVVGIGVASECLKSGQEDENGGPPVVEGEGEVDKEFISHVLSLVMLLDEVIDVGYSRADEERKDEGDNVVSTRPNVYVNRVEHGQEWEAPSNSINDDVLAGISELIDEVSEE